MLCKNPAVMKTLTAEIRSAFVDPRDITVETASKLKYLDAVIHEGYVMMSECTLDDLH